MVHFHLYFLQPLFSDNFKKSSQHNLHTTSLAHIAALLSTQFHTTQKRQPTITIYKTLLLAVIPNSCLYSFSTNHFLTHHHHHLHKNNTSYLGTREPRSPHSLYIQYLFSDGVVASNQHRQVETYLNIYRHINNHLCSAAVLQMGAKPPDAG